MHHQYKRTLGGFALIALFAAGAAAQDTVQPDMVYVPAVVSSSRNVFVPGLKAENFKITEENANQNVSYLSPEGSPITVLIVLADKKLQPGSVDQESRLVREAAQTIQDSLPPGSNYLLSELKSGTGTTLPDAVAGALTVMGEKPNPRKAIIIITDGFDNAAQPGDQLVDLARRVSVPTYIILLQDRDATTFDQGFADMTNDTGGRIIITITMDGLVGNAKLLMNELNSEYILGYKSTNTAKDNKWRKLKVSVDPPAGSPKLDVNSKSRYFVAKPAKK